MSSGSDSWDLWLKLIFILACCMLIIVGIALAANVWTNCRFRKQVKHEQNRDREHGAVIIQPWVRGGPRNKKKQDEEDDDDGFKEEKLFGVDGIYNSRPYSGFNLSYSNSDVASSHNSNRSALLPPRPDMTRSHSDHNSSKPDVSGPRPVISTRTSVTTLPYSPSHPRSHESKRPSLPGPRGSKTSLSQFQEMPAEETAYVTASPNVLQTFLSQDVQEPAITAPRYTYMPYRSIDSAIRHSTISYPSTAQRDSLQNRNPYQQERQPTLPQLPPLNTSQALTTPQNPHQPLSASSRYSHTLPSFSAAGSPIDNNNNNNNNNNNTPFIPNLPEIADDSASAITTIPIAPTLANRHTLNPYTHSTHPSLDAVTYPHNICTRPFSSSRACSEPPFRNHTGVSISPASSRSNKTAIRSHRTSDGFALSSLQQAQIQDDRPLLADAELAPLHMSPVRQSELMNRPFYGGMGMASRQVPAIMPVQMREAGGGYGNGNGQGQGYGWGPFGMRRDPEYWARARQEELNAGMNAGTNAGASVVDMVRTEGKRVRRKLQKRRPGEVQARSPAWSGW